MTDLIEIADRPLTSVNPGSAGMSGRYLTFVVNGEFFAINIRDVAEILAYRELTTVPMTPSFVRGVLNLYGRAVPVIDIAARFGRGTTDCVRRTSIVVVEVADGAAGRNFGIMVDGVTEVVQLGAADIEPPPRFGAGIRADFIAGMAKRNGAFAIVLDIGHVLPMNDPAQP